MRVKVKMYRDKIGGLYYYMTIESDKIILRSNDEEIELENNRQGKLWVKNNFAFKRVKYLTPADLVELSKQNNFRKWAGDQLDKMGFNY